MTTMTNFNHVTNTKSHEPSELAVLLDRDAFKKLYTLESLAQVGAYTMAVLAYAHGTSREFSHAIADCSEETREKVLTDCVAIWKQRHKLLRERFKEAG